MMAFMPMVFLMTLSRKNASSMFDTGSELLVDLCQ